ncbi:Uncharacterized protein PBTT_07575 [Plasmodiophora brassicae]
MVVDLRRCLDDATGHIKALTAGRAEARRALALAAALTKDRQRELSRAQDIIASTRAERDQLERLCGEMRTQMEGLVKEKDDMGRNASRARQERDEIVGELRRCRDAADAEGAVMREQIRILMEKVVAGEEAQARVVRQSADEHAQVQQTLQAKDLELRHCRTALESSQSEIADLQMKLRFLLKQDS